MSAHKRPLVLSLAPCHRGFAYVVLEGPESPFDWGVKRIREANKNQRITEIVAQLIERYQPKAVVLEDWIDPRHRRCSRVRALYGRISALAKKRRIPVKVYTREQVRERFAHLGSNRKRDIAVEIANRIPAFSYQLPPVRKPWMPEDPRQGLYDAVAVGLTFFGSRPSEDGSVATPEAMVK